MKKINLCLMILILIFSTTSCIINQLPSNKPENSPAHNSGERTYNLSSGIKDTNLFECEFDFDFDGNSENIRITADEEEMTVNIGNYTSTVEYMFGYIGAVYACDIDTDDSSMELAVITVEVSEDPRLRIFRYTDGLEMYNFRLYNYSSKGYDISESNWIGYVSEFDLRINDDNTMTVKEQTESYGMWSVYKTYYLIEPYIFTEQVPEKYEIVNDRMQITLDYATDLTPEEKDMWKKGYIQAHTDCVSPDYTLNKGEYFKPVYDTGKNQIYVEKLDGDGLLIDISDINQNSKLNNYYFALAG